MAAKKFDDALGASYRLVEKVGQGATGEVWEATDLRTGERVAAKLLYPQHAADRDLVGRFIQERSVLESLQHPNIVGFRDLVAEGDKLAIVMDFVAGGSLRDRLDTAPTLPPAMALTTMAFVLDALAASHGHGVLHRDIKPDNVLLDPAWGPGNPGALKVSDFGIASVMMGDTKSTTGLIGTPEYMSPELIYSGQAGFAADVYSAGIMAYELIAGRTPFAGAGTDYAIAHRHVQSRVPVLDVPEPLWDLLSSLLEKDPARRPSAQDAAAACRRTAPLLAQLPALEPAAAPEDFEGAHPMTVLKAPEQPAADDTDTEPADIAPAPELAAPSDATRLREITPYQPEKVELSAPQPEPAGPKRPSKRMVLLIIGAAMVLIGVSIFAVAKGGGRIGSKHKGSGTVKASQQDDDLPTGLGIQREATYDDATQSINLTITYQAQKAPLEGPFLEVIPGVSEDADCPDVTWLNGAEARHNLTTTSGLSVECGWAVDPGAIPAGQRLQVQAQITMALDGGDAESALQTWLTQAAAATTEAVTDSTVKSTHYPVQRLQDITVKTPDRVVNQSDLEISLLPVWPSGEDDLNPLYRSPSTGQPSSMLRAIAGGETGVRFSDGCAGALTVTSNGLHVAAQQLADSCVVNAQVGNFTDLSSNSFQITGHES
ncbi:serine/threonine-protein kinase [Propionibacterium australiense]|uniref:non-specific serine/threonine protein kinase n=1 Tax=Propionibacterium australiense TaxID=119981 RepID=A0A8B3FM36_9ACTN|nr:serine/threonine-protein kinase [Propionibacterium australiense]RLP06330.1 serine/threonine protein kinase [Propionibacterium australiense]